MSNLLFLKGEFFEIMVGKETILTMLILYLSMIIGLRFFMKSRTPLRLKFPLLVYNLMQFGLNVYTVWGLSILPFMSEIPNIFGISAKYTMRLEYFVFVHYISKYFDFLETAFIILRGKERQQLSFLHVYHHASIGTIWGTLLFIGHGNGTAAFGCLINSAVNCLMYGHYFLTALGFHNPFKRAITTAQLAQLALCIAHAALVLSHETIVPRPYAWAQLLYHVQMLALFVCFFRRAYLSCLPPRRSSPRAATAGHARQAARAS